MNKINIPLKSASQYVKEILKNEKDLRNFFQNEMIKGHYFLLLPDDLTVSLEKLNLHAPLLETREHVDSHSDTIHKKGGRSSARYFPDTETWEEIPSHYFAPTAHYIFKLLKDGDLKFLFYEPNMPSAGNSRVLCGKQWNLFGQIGSENQLLEAVRNPQVPLSTGILVGSDTQVQLAIFGCCDGDSYLVWEKNE